MSPLVFKRANEKPILTNESPRRRRSAFLIPRKLISLSAADFVYRLRGLSPRHSSARRKEDERDYLPKQFFSIFFPVDSFSLSLNFSLWGSWTLLFFSIQHSDYLYIQQPGRVKNFIARISHEQRERSNKTKIGSNHVYIRRIVCIPKMRDLSSVVAKI